MVTLLNVARTRVEMHFVDYLKGFCEGEYIVTLKNPGISDFETHEAVKRLPNIDEKNARLGCLGRRRIAMSAEIDDVHVDISENQLSLTVIETIRGDGSTPTPAAVVISENKIIEHWLTSS